MADPVQWRIVEKIAEMAKDITTANGYNHTVLETNTEEVSVENIDQFPCINVLTGTEEYSDPEETEGGRLVNTFNVVLDCYLEGEENKQKETSLLVADIKKRFFQDQDTDPPNGIFAYNLEGTCNIALPVRSEPFNVESTKHLFGFEFTMEIHYRQSRDDPTVLYN